MEITTGWRTRKLVLAIGCSLLGCGTPSSSRDQPDAGSARAIASPRAKEILTRVEPLRAGLGHVPVDAQLPQDSTLPISLRERSSGVALEVRLRGARAVRAENSGGWQVFVGAEESGGHVARLSLEDGFEDFILFDRPPPRAEVSYEIALSPSVAGLRLLADTLEVLDAHGVPRLRVAPPLVVDARGRSHAAHLVVDGCAADASDASPYGRPVTHAGASRCVLRVCWNASDVVHPAVLDPLWSTTGSMATPREDHGAGLLGSKVLVAGGRNGASVTSSAELYDPLTKTWASAGTMSQARYGAASSVVGGKLLLAGGYTTTYLKSADIYDPSTGWSSTGSLLRNRMGGVAVTLSGDRVLVVGGYEGASLWKVAELWDASSKTFRDVAPMTTGRQSHTVTVLPTNQVVVTGGESASGYPYSSVEIFTPPTTPTGLGSWAIAASMPDQRSGHAAMVLPSGKLMVMGGTTAFLTPLIFHTKTLSFDGASWSVVDPHAFGYESPTLTLLPTGHVLARGGDHAELFDPLRATWSVAPGTSVMRYGHTATLLGTGAVLVAGGGSASSAELFVPSSTGTKCTGGGECSSGFCVDGFCCDTSCTGICFSCSAALKASGAADGTCGPAKAAIDPHDDCPDDGAPTCARNGLCDGAGACQTYPAKPCSPRPCTKGSECASGFCTDGICCDKKCDGACEACTATMTGGKDGQCALVPAGSDPRARCPADKGLPASCGADGMCDGAGNCRAYAPKGTVCGTISCKVSSGEASVPACDGGGACVVSAVACAPFACKPDGSACEGTCADDTKCGLGSFCSKGTCTAKKANGATATEARECASGFVADGVCCSGDCKGACEACDLSATVGTCTAVVGAARHGTCPHASAGGDPCATASCDGTDRDKCARFVGPEVTCRSAGCSAGVQTLPAKCDGSGACPKAETKTCEPYLCEGDVCLAACRFDTDCVSDRRCEGGKCVAQAKCDGDHTVLGPTGTPTDCSPFVCNGSKCKEACDTSSDCVAGFACDPATHRCTPAGSFAGPGVENGGAGGCSNSPTRESDGSAAALLLCAACALLLRARRRTRPLAWACAGLSLASCEPVAERTVGSDDLSPTPHELEISLPERHDAPFRLRHAATNVEVAVSVVDARGARVEVRRLPEGVEDLLFFDRPAPTPAIDYRIELGPGVAALRLVSNTLELLDAKGAPRLRAAPAWVRDASGTRHDARLEITDCAVDRSLAPPWDRPHVAPASSACTLRVTWPSGLAHPLVLDPVWTSAGAMATKRFQHTASLSGTRVLVAGGRHEEDGGVYLSTAELFDPATKTWAAVAAMSTVRHEHTATVLKSGKVLIAGGWYPSIIHSTTEIYDPSTGSFSPGPTMAKTRRDHVAAFLPATGKVLVAGGYSYDLGGGSISLAELYDPILGTWSSAGSMATARSFAAAIVLPSGNVLVTGGNNGTNLSSAEIFDGAWKPAGMMATAKSGHPAALLSSGKGLVMGTSNAEIYDPGSGPPGTWITAAGPTSPRILASLTALTGGKALFAGGRLAAPALSVAEIFDESSGSWTSTAPMLVPRSWHSATSLSGGGVMLIGGWTGFEAMSTAELFGQLPLGAACIYPGECTSGQCVDGVCCDSPCTGTCRACKGTTGPDGTCGYVKAGGDLRGDCPDDGAASCSGRDGWCDGAGACEKYPSTSCSPSPCTSGADCSSGICVDAVCCDKACAGPCEACTKTKKGSGVDGACGFVAAGTDPRDRCAADPTPFSCKADGFCDGSGGCRMAAKGTLCATASCSGGEASSSMCDGSGLCIASATACAPYACLPGGTKCAASCASDAECDGSAWCDGSACKPKKIAGEKAGAARACASGVVADGVCCKSECNGVCQACDAPGTEGTCVPVVGTARHGACAVGPSGGDPCAALACDGVDGTKCAKLAGAEIACGPRACKDGIESLPTRCDGSGKCPAPTTKACDPYVCEGSGCRTSCRSDADCAGKRKCDATGKCVEGGSCDGDHTFTAVDGTAKDCAPYRCSGSSCRTTCGSTADCIAGRICDTSSGQCVDAVTPSGESGGCSYSARTQGSALLVPWGLLALALARRRRRPGVAV